MLTWADGVAELISVHVATVADKSSSVHARLPADALKQLLGGSVPPVRDGTTLNDLRVGASPAWSGHDSLGTIVSLLNPAASCHHGQCSRIPLA